MEISNAEESCAMTFSNRKVQNGIPFHLFGETENKAMNQVSAVVEHAI